MRWSNVTLDYGGVLTSGSSGLQVVGNDNGTHLNNLPEDMQINTGFTMSYQIKKYVIEGFT